MAKLNFMAKGTLETATTETLVAIADLLPAITTFINTITSAEKDWNGGFDASYYCCWSSIRIQFYWYR